MLQFLQIQNYALIQDQSVNFSSGFSAVTGETGAGKSIFLKALQLLLGKRADRKIGFYSDKNTIIEAHFSLKNAEIFSDLELEINCENPIIFRRVFSPSGSSRCFIQDFPVPLETMKKIGEALCDIYAQGENTHFRNTDFVYELVDFFSGIADEIAAYRLHFFSWKECQKKLENLRKLKEADGAESADWQEQLDRFATVDLDLAIREGWEEKKSGLENLSAVRQAISFVSYTTSDETEAPLDRLEKAKKELISVEKFFPKSTQWIERLDFIINELKDLQGDAFRAVESLQEDAESYELMMQSWEKISALQYRYHNKNISELVKIRNSLQEKISTLGQYDHRIDELETFCEKEKNKCREMAQKISKKRQKNIPVLTERITELMNEMGVGLAQIEIRQKTSEFLNEWGGDELEFLFSANKNFPLLPVARVASGGEFSRLILAMKFLSRGDKNQTLIFDEIDTGVSGETAFCMARLMKKISEKNQIIAITHLPSVAALAGNHYHIVKDHTGQQSQTQIEKISAERRVGVIAEMLGGKDGGKNVLEHAKKLLN